MDLPERLTVSACIGCGAMEVLNACEDECLQRKLVVVFGDDHDDLVAVADAAAARAAVLARAAGAVLEARPGGAGAEAHYRRLQVLARQAVAADRHAGAGSADAERVMAEPATEHVLWWCPACGRVEAPQPCIGVCIRRPALMVNAEIHRRERARALAALAVARASSRSLTQLAYTTPRPGSWQRSLEAIQRTLEPVGAWDAAGTS